MDLRQQIINAIKALFTNANTSAASLWMRIVDILYNILNIINTEINNSQTQVVSSARNLRVMRKDYYIDKAISFQYGDNLVYLDNDTKQLGYNPIVESNRIIKQATISVQENGLLLNVASSDSNGDLRALSTDEYNAFVSYYDNWVPLGFNVVIQSRQPDILLFPQGMTIYYLSDTSLTNIKNDVEQMKQTIQQNIVLGAPLFINDLEFDFQQIDGVESVYIPEVNSKSDQGITCPSSNGRIYLSAGYFNFNETINITYVAV